MKKNDDFGFESVDWNTVEASNLKLALTEYEHRFQDTVTSYNDLESKARWQFAIVWPIASLLTAYMIANWNGIPHCGGLAISFLVVTMWLGLLVLYYSTFVRSYSGKGMTPNSMQINEWEPFLKEAKEKNRFLGMKIRALARSIDENTASNAQKSKYLKWASIINLSTLPVAAIIAILCLIFIDAITLGTACPVTA